MQRSPLEFAAQIPRSNPGILLSGSYRDSLYSCQRGDDSLGRELQCNALARDSSELEGSVGLDEARDDALRAIAALYRPNLKPLARGSLGEQHLAGHLGRRPQDQLDLFIAWTPRERQASEGVAVDSNQRKLPGSWQGWARELPVFVGDIELGLPPVPPHGTTI